MKKTTMLAALIATSIGSAAMAAEATPTTAPKAAETIVTPSATTHANPMTTAVVIERAQSGAHLGSKLVGAGVYSTTGERLGDVNDLILDTTGKITGVVVGVGGFLGVGEKNVALTWDSVTVGAEEKGKPRLSVHVTKDALEKAAPFVVVSKS